MGYSRKNVEAVLNEFEAKRQESKAQSVARLNNAYSLCPEIAKIDKELSKTGLKIFKVAMMGKENLEKNIRELENENQALLSKRAELLASLGFEKDYTDQKFDCDLCQDTGYYNGKMCSCFKKSLTNKGYESSGIANLLKSQSFESFSLEAYPEEAQPIMKKNYNKLKKYSKQFSENKENLLLVGGTGLGKTHLSTAVAKELIDNGFDVVYETAQNVFSDFDTDRFRDHYGDSEVVSEKYFECDLLIIDDLGAEIITNNSVSYLYNVINTRINKKLPIIISTNFSAKEIMSKYHDRITSRLFGDFTIVKFEGVDIRKAKIKK